MRLLHTPRPSVANTNSRTQLLAMACALRSCLMTPPRCNSSPALLAQRWLHHPCMCAPALLLPAVAVIAHTQAHAPSSCPSAAADVIGPAPAGSRSHTQW
jgi:hypothetical protein